MYIILSPFVIVSLFYHFILKKRGENMALTEHNVINENFN